MHFSSLSPMIDRNIPDLTNEKLAEEFKHLHKDRYHRNIYMVLGVKVKVIVSLHTHIYIHTHVFSFFPIFLEIIPHLDYVEHGPVHDIYTIYIYISTYSEDLGNRIYSSLGRKKQSNQQNQSYILTISKEIIIFNKKVFLSPQPIDTSSLLNFIMNLPTD